MDPLPKPVDLTDYLLKPSAAVVECARLFQTNEPLVIFDIGACEGEDSIRYSRMFPHSHIHAFEPLPANQSIIRTNLDRYKATNAELVPLALSDKTGSASFHVSSGRPKDEFAGKDWNYGNKSSSLLASAQSDPMHGWINFNESIVVPTETLDNFCRARRIGHIDFIQMDVQGAELLVLKGAEQTLARISAIWLEVSSKENYQEQAIDGEIKRFMRRHGFKLGYQIYREDGSGEGDHLYLNLRHPRTWRHALTRNLRSTLGNAKRALLKHLSF